MRLLWSRCCAEEALEALVTRFWNALEAITINALGPLPSLIKRLPRLRHLTARSYEWSANFGTVDAVNSCLQDLSVLLRAEVSVALLNLVRSCPGLRHLRLEATWNFCNCSICCSSKRVASVGELFSALPRGLAALRLSLEPVPCKSDNYLSYRPPVLAVPEHYPWDVLPQRCPALECLHLAYVPLGSTFTAALAAMEHLRTLTLCGCPNLSWTCLRNLVEWLRLRVLHYEPPSLSSLAAAGLRSSDSGSGSDGDVSPARAPSAQEPGAKTDDASENRESRLSQARRERRHIRRDERQAATVAALARRHGVTLVGLRAYSQMALM